MSKVKKLVLILAISLLITKTSKEDYISLKQMLYIYYLLRFQKNIISVKALIDPSNKANTIIPVYILKLDIKVYHTNVETQKINGFILKTFGIVLANF